MKLIARCHSCSTQYDLTGFAVGSRIRCQCGEEVVVPQPREAEARIVRCPSCGASRGSSGATCQFCSAVFSTVDKGWGSMCPACFCRLPNDARFCVECGLKIDPQQFSFGSKSTDANMNCPRCVVPLQKRILEQTTIHECGGCAGVWLSVDVFADICKDRDKQSIATRGLKTTQNVAMRLPDENVKYVPCPVCKTLMNRHNFGRVSGVIIDTCSHCGVWLDNQELNRIVKFIQDGGLERTRNLEQRERVDHSRQVVSFPSMLPQENRSKHRSAILIDVVAEIAKHFWR